MYSMLRFLLCISFCFSVSLFAQQVSGHAVTEITPGAGQAVRPGQTIRMYLDPKYGRGSVVQVNLREEKPDGTNKQRIQWIGANQMIFTTVVQRFEFIKKYLEFEIPEFAPPLPRGNKMWLQIDFGSGEFYESIYPYIYHRGP